MKRLIIIALVLFATIASAEDYQKQIVKSDGNLTRDFNKITDTLSIGATNIFLPIITTYRGMAFDFWAILAAGTDSITLYALGVEDYIGNRPLNDDTLKLSIVDSFKVTTAGHKTWQIDTAFVNKTGYPRFSQYSIKIINRGATTGAKLHRGIIRTDRK